MWTGSNLAICCFFIWSAFNGCSDCITINLTRSELVRQRRQTDCDGFQCRNGQCVDEDVKCDGRVDCDDGSDETTLCRDLMCRGNIFRCQYGACISKKLECDGKKDCRDGSDETSPRCGNVLRNKCNSTEFECKNKQCINIDNKCDGTPDCTDLSDETEEACLKLACPGHTFKCKYGACISRKGRCNGITECFDGSDESKEECGDLYIPIGPNPFTPTPTPTPKPTPTPTPTRPSGKPRPPNIFTPGSCILPPNIANGSWEVSNAIYDYHAGDLVEAGTTINITCGRRFVVSGTESNVALSICFPGLGWSITNPKCIRICQPLTTTGPTRVTCTNDKIDISCRAPTDGTTAKFSCPLYYELSTYNDLRFCTEGSWDEDEPKCKPVCGQKSVNVKELIIGGKKVRKGYYPWSIALYKHDGESFQHVCGGSLLNERVVATAAHCVTDMNGKKREKTLYRVAAGKYYRDYYNQNDTDAEFSEIEEIFVASNYKASTWQYVGDIALLALKEHFNASLFIQRICVDWDPESLYEGKLLNTKGVVTGWGYTVRGAKESEVLKEISLPYIDFQQCYDSTPEEFKTYVREDKMCAGYYGRGIGVCEGDSGGGLAFLNPDGPKRNRFYLRGIVSTSPQIDGSCDEFKYAFFTKVSSYIRFIWPIVRQYRDRN